MVGEPDQFLPRAFKGQLQFNARYSVFEVSDSGHNGLPVVGQTRFERLHDRRALKANVFGRRVTKGGFSTARPGTENRMQLIQIGTFRDIEQMENSQGSVEAGSGHALSRYRNAPTAPAFP